MNTKRHFTGTSLVRKKSGVERRLDTEETKKMYQLLKKPLYALFTLPGIEGFLYFKRKSNEESAVLTDSEGREYLVHARDIRIASNQEIDASPLFGTSAVIPTKDAYEFKKLAIALQMTKDARKYPKRTEKTDAMDHVVMGCANGTKSGNSRKPLRIGARKSDKAS